MIRRRECRHAQTANTGLAHRPRPAAASELFARYKTAQAGVAQRESTSPAQRSAERPNPTTRDHRYCPDCATSMSPHSITIATSPSSHDTRPGPASRVPDRRRLPSEAPQRKSVTNLHSKCAPRSPPQQHRQPRRPKLGSDYRTRSPSPATVCRRIDRATENRSSRVLQTCPFR